MMKKVFFYTIIAFLCFLFSGCFNWKAEFNIKVPTRSTDPNLLLNQAFRAADTANTVDKLQTAIMAFEKVLESDPLSYDALCHLSTYNLLLGDAYLQKSSEKIDCFKKALQYSEWAMYTNPAFKRMVDSGKPVWEAVDSLSVEQMDAMLFWTTAVFYYYKEGLGAFGQIINYPWIRRAKRVLARMTGLEPAWGGGGVYFIWGIYYLSIPRSVGGNRTLSAVFFEKAIEAGPNWLLNRWGRAKYFHVKLGNRDQFVEDLQWVLDQDIAAAGGPYAWKVYFINDARYMLGHIDDYF